MRKNTIVLCLLWSVAIYSYNFTTFYFVLIPNVDPYLVGVALFSADIIGNVLSLFLKNLSFRTSFTIVNCVLVASSFILQSHINGRSDVEIDLKSIVSKVMGS